MMKRRWNNYLLLAMTFLAFFIIPGCSMESGAPEGGLIIQVMDATTRNIFESTNNLTGNDMQIMGYEIKLTPPQTNEKKAWQTIIPIIVRPTALPLFLKL